MKHIKYHVDDLIEHINDHLKYEESLLEKYNYPLLSEHMNEHKKFSDLIEELNSILSDARKELSETLGHFAEYW